MSRTLNKVMLIGNVGKDPEMKYTPSKIPVASFRLATSETWKDRDGQVKEHTDWHTVVAWRGLAEVVQKLVKKGSRVYIEGKVQTRVFDDKNNIRKHVTEILAENLLILDGRKAKEEFGFDGDSHNDEFDHYIATESNIYSSYNNSDNEIRSDEIPF